LIKRRDGFQKFEDRLLHDEFEKVKEINITLRAEMDDLKEALDHKEKLFSNRLEVKRDETGGDGWFISKLAQLSEKEKKLLNLGTTRNLHASDEELQIALGVSRVRVSQLLHELYEKGLLSPGRIENRKKMYEIHPDLSSELIHKYSQIEYHVHHYPTERALHAYLNEMPITNERQYIRQKMEHDLRKDMSSLQSEDGGTRPTRMGDELEVIHSCFEPVLAFVSGPTTSNLVLSFFLSNPDLEFSREETFAHINRHCEQLGIEDFFRVEMGYEFSSKAYAKKDAEGGLTIGRTSILRAIGNLENTGVLQRTGISEARSKYKLAKDIPGKLAGHDDNNWRKVKGLLRLAHETKQSVDYSKFRVYCDKRKENITEIDSFVKQGDDLKATAFRYIADLRSWAQDQNEYFCPRLSRLSYYSELNGESYSSVKRKWKFALYEAILNHHQEEEGQWLEFCKNLGAEKKIIEDVSRCDPESKQDAEHLAETISSFLQKHKSI
jgi:DNA-binding transcriptional ArsR family regulator